MKLKAIYISPQSNYWSEKMGKPGSAPTHKPTEIQCDAGSGLVGDRFYNYKKDYRGQVTFFSYDYYQEIQREFSKEFCASVFRRNILVSGINPIELLGKTFQINGVVFEGSSDCDPCKWMDTAVAPGTYEWMKSKQAGGLRAKILESGIVKIGDLLEIT